MEVRFIGQSKGTTLQVHCTEKDTDKDINDKVLEEAKRVYAKGLMMAKDFTMSQK